MSERDGGPAFACAAENGHQAGMSLRDYFAGQVLVGICGSADLLVAASQEARARGLPHAQAIALAAYEQADAMLKARTLHESGTSESTP